MLDRACAHIGMTHMQHQAVDICYSSNDNISECNNTKLLSLAYQLYVLPVLSVLQRGRGAAHRV